MSNADETQISEPQNFKATFIQNVTCIFLSIRLILLLSVHFETPFIRIFFRSFKCPLFDCTFFVSYVSQNLHWNLGQQTLSVGTLLAYLETKTWIIFFRNKTLLFFKIESWNSICLKKKYRETSQNFNSIRQQIEKVEIKIVCISYMSWNFVRFHNFFFQTDAKRFSFLSWKTKKKYMI